MRQELSVAVDAHVCGTLGVLLMSPVGLFCEIKAKEA